jgi:hypothetical protein
MIFLPLLLILALQTPASTPDQITSLLQAKDQALLDSIAGGDKKLWEQALAADAVIVDESGAVMDRAEYLKTVEPLPPGISGSIKISSFSAHVSGDLATVVHTDDEVENFHGQVLNAQYLMTETWQREENEWKLHLLHVYAMLKDPPAISLAPEALKQYEGRYRASADLLYVIQWDGKQLVGGRDGRALKPLQVEVRDVLFVAGQPRIRKIFQRDATGKVTGFFDRRESWDLIWSREGP